MKTRSDQQYSDLCSAMASGKPVQTLLPPEVDNVFYERMGMSAEDIFQLLSMDETLL